MHSCWWEVLITYSSGPGNAGYTSFSLVYLLMWALEESHACMLACLLGLPAQLDSLQKGFAAGVLALVAIRWHAYPDHHQQVESMLLHP